MHSANARKKTEGPARETVFILEATRIAAPCANSNTQHLECRRWRCASGKHLGPPCKGNLGCGKFLKLKSMIFRSLSMIAGVRPAVIAPRATLIKRVMGGGPQGRGGLPRTIPHTMPASAGYKGRAIARK